MNDDGPLTSGYFNKSRDIYEFLRGQIVTGEYRPGAKMPTRQQMIDDFDVSSATLQRALDRLLDDGFVVTAGRRGTFVAETPPHLNRYALLFPARAANGVFSNHYWNALWKATDLLEHKEAEFALYSGYERADEFVPYDELIADVESQRLAGLIFANVPWMLEHTPLVTRTDLPRTTFASHYKDDGIPVVGVDWQGFVDRAFAHVAALGCRRPAVVAPSGRLAYAGTVPEQARDHGLHLRPERVQSMDIQEPGWARNLLRLLLADLGKGRPDCLIVANDNLALAVTRALEELGLTDPEKFPVVVECNWPLPPAVTRPVTFFGYDLCAGLRQNLVNIDDQRQGRQPAWWTVLPALAASEVDCDVEQAVCS